MTKKEDLQQEIKEKVKAGIKPSDLRKLKKSKSADDIANVPTAPPLPLVNDQLAEKQKQIEGLREQLEKTNYKLAETIVELDNSLQARVAGVKVFGEEHDKRTKAQKELNETIDEASSELTAGDDQVSKLRTKLLTANQEINRLNNELKLARIKRGTSPVDNSLDNLPNPNYLKLAFYSLLALLFILSLNNQKSQKHYD